MQVQGIESVIADCGELIRRFADANKRLYLVGGIVRDVLSGLSCDLADIDFTSDATPDEIVDIIEPIAESLWRQGERFGTIGARISGRDVEITTHRGEKYSPDSRKPTVTFSTDLVEDLSRRDFTINAMAIDVMNSQAALVDPFNGLADLRANLLATPIDPNISIQDDPLRMMRAARFVARSGCKLSGELDAALRSNVDRISIVSVERIRVELDKLLLARYPLEGLQVLASVGLLERVVPELCAVEQESPQTFQLIATAVSEVESESVTRWAALMCVMDAASVKSRMRRLKHANDMVRDVGGVVELWHRYFVQSLAWSDAKVREVVHQAGDRLGPVRNLAGVATSLGLGAGDVELFDQKFQVLNQSEDLSHIGPELDGTQIIEFLAIPPGRIVGEALAELMRLRIDTGPVGSAAAAAHVLKWWTEHPDNGRLAH